MSTPSPTPPAPIDDDPAAACQAALRRLAASRQRLATELLPQAAAEPGEASSVLRHPLQALARWWQRHQPLDLLQDWLRAPHTRRPASVFDTAFDAMRVAVSDAARFARRQPAGALGLALGLGGLAYLLRRPLWRAGLAVAAVASQRTRAWLLTIATDPAIYQTLFAAWLAQRAASAASQTAAADDEASKPAPAATPAEAATTD